MSYTKTLRIMAAAMMASGLLVSCREKPAETPDPVPLTLSAQVMSLDYEGNSLWGEMAEIGVFVTESGSSKIVGDNENVRYTAKFATGIISLTASDEPVTLPEKATTIDIAAYYPYSAELSESGNSKFVYHADLSDQESLDPEILLIAGIDNRNSALHTAMLTLKPAFAKLKVRLRNQAGTKAADVETEIRLGNIPCDADIDILSGEYISYGALKSTVLSKPIATTHMYEAVVLAQDTPDNAMLEVRIPERESGKEETVSINMKDIVSEFKANTQYDITVTVSPSGVEATLVGMSDFFVSDWKEDFEDINGETN